MWGQLFKVGIHDSRFAKQVHYPCIYLASYLSHRVFVRACAVTTMSNVHNYIHITLLYLLSIQVRNYACLYTSKVENLLHVSPNK